MTKAIRLTRDEARAINQKTTRHGAGVLKHFKFSSDANDDTKKWSIEDISDFMRSMPHQYQPRAYEIWVTGTNITLGLWAPDKEHLSAMEKHWKNFNNSLIDFTPQINFPPIRPGSFVRVSRIKPARNAHHTIEWRFGTGKNEGRLSPIIHLLNNIPKVPDGVTIVIQTMWKKNRALWRMNPLTHLDFSLNDSYHEEALEWKKMKRSTYYADIRICEIHSEQKTARTDFSNFIGEAYSVWNRENCNRLTYDRLKGFTRRKIINFVNAIQDRDINKYPIKGRVRPYFTKEELSSLIHPPPSGSKVPMGLYTSVKAEKASAVQKLQAKKYEEILNQIKQDGKAKEGTGKQRRMTSKEAKEILKRQQRIDQLKKKKGEAE